MLALKLRDAGALALLAFTLSVAGTAHAIGTQAGTSVSNQATVDYTVGGVDQADIPSSPTGNSEQAEDYTHIRWELTEPLAPGESRSFEFRARLD